MRRPGPRGGNPLTAGAKPSLSRASDTAQQSSRSNRKVMSSVIAFPSFCFVAADSTEPWRKLKQRPRILDQLCLQG